MSEAKELFGHRNRNWYLRKNGCNIVVFPKRGLWYWRIYQERTGRSLWSKLGYATVDACKLAVLDTASMLI